MANLRLSLTELVVLGAATYLLEDEVEDEGCTAESEPGVVLRRRAAALGRAAGDLDRGGTSTWPWVGDAMMDGGQTSRRYLDWICQFYFFSFYSWFARYSSVRPLALSSRITIVTNHLNKDVINFNLGSGGRIIIYCKSE